MTLRTKTLIILVVSYICFMATLCLFFWFTLSKAVTSLENNSISLYVKQFKEIFEDEMNSLKPSIADWANWDDAYDYVTKPAYYDKFVEERVRDETLVNLNINFLVFINNDKYVTLVKEIDLSTGKEVEVSEDIIKTILKTNSIFNHKSKKSINTGVILVNNLPMVIASMPITMNSKKSPAGGLLIMGRYLTPQRIKELGGQSGAVIVMQSVENNLLTEDFREALPLLKRGRGPLIKIVNKNLIAGYILINDISNKPVLMFRVGIPRFIYNQNQKTFQYFILYLVIFSVVFGVITLLLFDMIILKRFSTVNELAERFRKSSDNLPTVVLKGNDELSKLVSTINEMFRAIDQARSEERKIKENLEVLVQNKTKALESSLIQIKLTNYQLKEANSHKTNFLSSMSHELRTPLNAVIGFSDLLSKKIFGELTEKQAEYITSINESGRYLLSLINDCLNISRIDLGKMELEFMIFSYEELLNDVVSMFKSQCIKKKVAITLELLQTERLLFADYLKSKQILINLLSNALKYSPEGSEIKIYAEILEEEKIKIFVKDQGIGIDEDKLSKIFEEFYQTDQKRDKKLGGIGLGLAITKRMVEMHNGNIGVESIKGQGATFWFTLPMTDKLAEQTVFENFDIKSFKDVVKGKNILVVDDDDVSLSLIIDILSVYEHEIAVARDGKEVIGLLESYKPDMIFMDIQMPEMDGIEAVKILRSKQEFLDIPIIATTAIVDKESRIKHIEAGFTDQLDKPFTSGELVLKANKYLKGIS